MKPITCVCGKEFYKRINGRRCPHCSTLIQLPTDHLSQFECFAQMERERGRVGVVSAIDDYRHVGIFFYDASKQGPERWGWKGWPPRLTQEERTELLELQAQNSKCDEHGCKKVALPDDLFCEKHREEEDAMVARLDATEPRMAMIGERWTVIND